MISYSGLLDPNAPSRESKSCRRISSHVVSGLDAAGIEYSPGSASCIVARCSRRMRLTTTLTTPSPLTSAAQAGSSSCSCRRSSRTEVLSVLMSAAEPSPCCRRGRRGSHAARNRRCRVGLGWAAGCSRGSPQAAACPQAAAWPHYKRSSRPTRCTYPGTCCAPRARPPATSLLRSPPPVAV